MEVFFVQNQYINMSQHGYHPENREPTISGKEWASEELSLEGWVNMKINAQFDKIQLRNTEPHVYLFSQKHEASCSFSPFPDRFLPDRLLENSVYLQLQVRKQTSSTLFPHCQEDFHHKAGVVQRNFPVPPRVYSYGNQEPSQTAPDRSRQVRSSFQEGHFSGIFHILRYRYYIFCLINSQNATAMRTQHLKICGYTIRLMHSLQQYPVSAY